MKTKPTSHKSSNTFKFETFNERISKIKIDVVHRVGIQRDTPEDSETFFHECLLKWNELNCTESFDLFRNELGRDIETLVQIVHNQDEIIACLEKHLKIKDSLALQPILELVVSLAKDLQSDFYPHFPKFFNLITDILAAKDSELLEWSFTALSYLFKFLWRCMIKDIQHVFILYLPLLNERHPEHIRNFAAESFGFLIRKVPDKGSLFDFIFLLLDEQPEHAIGIGQLLFEIVKGVKHQFHSCLESIFPLLLAKLGLGDEKRNRIKLPWDSVLESQLQLAQSMAEHTTQEHSVKIWKVLQGFINNLLSNCEVSDKPELVIAHLEAVLQILRAFTGYKKGKLIGNIPEYVEILKTLLKCHRLSDDCGSIVLDLVSSILLDLTVKLTVTNISQLVTLVFTSNFSRHVLFNFIRTLFAYGMFEKDVLPQVLVRCQTLVESNDDDMLEVLCLLADIVLHFRPLPKSGDELRAWQRYRLDFKCDTNNNMVWVMMKSILDKKMEDIFENLPLLSVVLVLAPHIRPLDRDHVIGRLQFLKQRYSLLEEDDAESIFNQIMTAQILIEEPSAFFKSFDYEELLRRLIRQPNNVFLLRIVDMVLTFVKNSESSYLHDENFKCRVFDVLQSNLSSPKAEVRRLTLRSLSSFDYFLPECEKNKNSRVNVFHICLFAEEVEASVASYREKLKHLQRLDYNLVTAHIPIGDYEHVALLYLIGSLHVSFRLLWDPIVKLIETYARGLKNKRFWQIYVPLLQDAASHVIESRNKMDTVGISSSSGSAELIYNKISALTEDHIDWTNHRQLMWKAMVSFIDITEPRNKDIVPIFFQFIETEYYVTDVDAATVQDVRKEKSILMDETFDFEESKIEVDDDEDSNSDDDGQEDDSLKKRKSSDKSKMKDKKRAGIQTLLAHLSVIAKFRNPKCLHRESDLREMFLDFLSHRNGKVQKLSLDYLTSYGDVKVTPYKENLYKLLDDKTFKTEVTAFNIDVQSKVLRDEDRVKVLPLLMRILYGKMQSRVGRNTSGRNNANLRRGIVLRFLAGAKEEELKLFMDLAFKPFLKYTTNDVNVMVRDIVDNLDPSAVIPLKRIQGALNLLGVIISKVGNLMDQHLSWLLKLLLCLLTASSQIVERKQEVQPRFQTVARDLRNSAILKLMQFFELFDNYPFTGEEVEAIFDAAVWPHLDRLHFESINSPSALLKLLAKWTSNPRYFPLLAKHHSVIHSRSTLPEVMSLLTSEKIRPPVIRFILVMLENLLTFADYDKNGGDEGMDEDGEGLKPKAESLIVWNCIDVCNLNSWPNDKEFPNYGTLLLLPHIPKILERLKLIVAKLSKSKNKGIPDTVLVILMRTSEFVTDSSQSSQLVSLLFPFLGRKGKMTEGNEVGILKAIALLLRNADEPERFIKKTASLFATLKHRNSRVALCEVLDAIAERDNRFKTAADVVNKLNAWDVRRVEEPDYNLRLDGYDAANRDIPEMVSTNPDYALLLIFNCCHIIKWTNDLSLRDSSSHFLKRLVSAFPTANEKEKETCVFLLHNAILPEIKKGLKSKEEVVRHEFIVVLATVIGACQDVPKMKDLHSLRDEDFDVDFFENIRHIQVHRRARALTRLARNPKLQSFQEETTMHYLMPLATSFLFTEVYEKQSNLIDAAVEFIGSVSKSLSWYRYELLLRQYLGLLSKNVEYQKVIVKLVVAILDAFHFDLSLSEGVACGLKEPPRKTVHVEEMEVDKVEEEEEEDEEQEMMAIEALKAEANVLSAAVATKIHRQIMTGILPQLNRCLTRKTRGEEEHKMNRSSVVDDSEIRRIPIALAMVKLLQNLPKGSLEQNLSGLFLKLCAFLKSRAESIRTTTRETIVKMMASLGPKYFPYLLKQMVQTMTKGYQVHVMIFTVNNVLHHLDDKLEVGDLDGCLQSLLQLCSTELFGNVAEEKEVDQIIGKLKEARGFKSYNLYKIIASYVSDEHLIALIDPIKQVLSSTLKHQVVHKAEECLRNVVLGLTENKSISPKTLLIFTHALINENIPDLNGRKKKAEPALLPEHKRRTDSYLLPAEPTRVGTAKTSKKTNAHILVSFGLQLLQFSLKRGKYSATELEHLEMLDPFVVQLIECITSVHVKIVSTSLSCLLLLLKYQLPSLKHEMKQLNKSLFLILNKYGGAGAAQGENFEMVVACFKVISSLVRDVDEYTVDEDQLRVLLTYAEQDIMDHTRQATAFSLLKAILSKKLFVKEMGEVMKKVAEMSITSEADNVRIQCRQVFHQYLIDYDIGKEMESHLSFYARQMEFEYEYGRQSALLMLINVIKTFPAGHLKKHIRAFFVPLSMALVNDDSRNCTKMAAEALKSLLLKVEVDYRDNLFLAVVTWLQDLKLRHRRLAVEVCGLFVEVEQKDFQRRIKEILPLVIECLKPKEKDDKIEKEGLPKTTENLLIYHGLNSVMKIVTECRILESVQWEEEMNALWECAESHLVHPCTMVRLKSSQLFGLLFSHYQTQDLVTNIVSPKKSTSYLMIDTRQKIYRVTIGLLTQLQDRVLKPELASQLVKNLVYIAQIARGLEAKDTNETEKTVRLDWLMKKMNREAKMEVANSPQETIKRTCVFKWLAAVAKDLGECDVGLDSRLSTILFPLHREMSDNSTQADPELKSLAQDVIDFIKGMVDQSVFVKTYAALQVSTQRKRTARKAEKAQEVLLHPEVSARKRIKKQLGKKDAKRRKLERVRPTKKPRGKSLRNYAIMEG